MEPTLFDDNEQAKKQYERLRDLDPESLVREDVLGTELSFAAVTPHVRTLQALFARLASIRASKLVPAQVQQLRNHLGSIDKQLDQIASFTTKQNDATGNRDRLVDWLRGVVDTIAKQHMHILITHEGEVHQRKLDHLDARLSEANDLLEARLADAVASTASMSEAALEQHGAAISELKDELTGLQVEARQVLEDARKAAGANAITAHVQHFNAAEQEYKRRAGRWLAAAIVSTGLTAATILVVGQYYFTHLAGSTDFNPHLTVLQVSFLSVLFFIVLFCARNFRANRHMQAVQGHRAVALQTFAAFAGAAQDPDIRGAVLLQTTQSIFGHQPTGFLTKEGDQAAGPLSVLEIVRSGKS